MINVSRWNAKEGEFEDCIPAEWRNASQLTSAAAINRFIKESMRKNKPSFKVTNPKIVLRVQKLSNLDVDNYAVASYSVNTWLAWVKVLKGNAKPQLKAYVYAESAANAADAIAKDDSMEWT